jgi:uncharacterized protein
MRCIVPQRRAASGPGAGRRSGSGPGPAPAMNGVEAFGTAGHGQPVRGFLHRPAAPAGDSVVLAHGAGGDCGAPLLVSLASGLAEAGLTVLRCDLPFRQARPSGPPPPGAAARDREGLRNAVLAVRGVAPGRAYLGGHSYGGRQASLLAADEPGLTAGLVLLAYPLHPPRRPETLRTAHFPRLRVPTLFVHGARDPFGSLEEMRAALGLIPAVTTLIAVAGASHDLGGGRQAVADVVSRAIVAFVNGPRAAGREEHDD